MALGSEVAWGEINEGAKRGEGGSGWASGPILHTAARAIFIKCGSGRGALLGALRGLPSLTG